MTGPDHRKNAQCNTCTLKLVSIAYDRSVAFRLMREPLKLGMRLLSRIYDVRLGDDDVRTAGCVGCIRFHKTALKEKSRFFRRMNDLCNPLFDAWLERIVTKDEVRSAKAYARAASSAEVTPADAAAWMKGLRTGFAGSGRRDTSDRTDGGTRGTRGRLGFPWACRLTWRETPHARK